MHGQLHYIEENVLCVSIGLYSDSVGVLTQYTQTQLYSHRFMYDYLRTNIDWTDDVIHFDGLKSNLLNFSTFGK